MLEKALDSLIEKQLKNRYGIDAKTSTVNPSPVQPEKQSSKAKNKGCRKELQEKTAGQQRSTAPGAGAKGNLMQKKTAGQQRSTAPGAGAKANLMQKKAATPQEQPFGINSKANGLNVSSQPATANKLNVSSKPSRYIPKRIRCEVYQRDDGQCAYVDQLGQRCPSRTQLEFHHKDPFAREGRHTVENLELRCGMHNRHEAREVYGEGFIGKRIQKRTHRCLKHRKGNAL